MSRRVIGLLSAVVVAVSMSLWGSAYAAPQRAAQSGSTAASSELSVTTRLADRREVAAGTRAYSIGFEDGRFYANGWHITGEMGGVWTPPLKLVDGVWFGLDGQWVGPATTVLQRLGLHPLRPARHRGLSVAAHRLRARRAARRAVRPHDHQPGRGPDRRSCPSTRTPS